MRFLNTLNGTSPEKILVVVRNALTTTIAANVPVYAITSTPNGVIVPDGTFVTDVNNGNQCMGYTTRAIPPSTAPTEVLAWGYHDGLATFVSVFGSGGGSSASAITACTFAALPATATVGDVRFVTDSVPPGIYECYATNSWARAKVGVHPDGSLSEDTSSGITRHRVTPGLFAVLSNNLSDLTSAATARTNLGIVQNSLTTAGLGHQWVEGRPGYAAESAVIGASAMHYQEWVPTFTQTIRAMVVYISTSGSGQYLSVGGYSTAGNKLAQSDTINVNAAGATSPTLSFATPWEVVAGVPYYFAYSASGTATLKWYVGEDAFTGAVILNADASNLRKFTGANASTGTSTIVMPDTIGAKTSESTKQLFVLAKS